MFEQSTLPNGPAGKRVWTTFIGMGSEVVVVLAMVLAPMVWPEVLPQAAAYIRLAPVPPPAPPGHPPIPKREFTAVVPKQFVRANALYAPKLVPERVAIIEDPPEVELG